MELTEDPTVGNPLRVKGGGEAGITPCLAAVVNALVDALQPLGVQHLDIPYVRARPRRHREPPVVSLSHKTLSGTTPRLTTRS